MIKRGHSLLQRYSLVDKPTAVGGQLVDMLLDKDNSS